MPGLPSRLGVLALLAALTAAPAPALDVALAITGDTDLEDDVRAASLLLGPAAEELTTAQDVLAAARADYTRIVGRLYAQGHYGPVVSILVDGREAAQIAPLDAPATVRDVRISVETGPAFRFGRTAIGPLAPDTELPEGFATGEPALTGVVREAAAEAVGTWRERGRAVAEVEDQSIVARHADAALDVSIAIRPGPVVRYGPLAVTGNSAVREERIREIVGIRPGARFDPVELQRAERRLRRTGAFRAATIIEGDALGPGDTLPLELTVVDAPPRRFGVGAELTTGTGATLSGFWMHRNLLGGAERLRFDAEIGGIGGTVEDDGVDYRASVLFNRPSTFRADQDLAFRIAAAREDEVNFTSDNATAEAFLTRYATDELTLTAGIELRYDRSEDATGERTFRLVSFPVSAEYDRRNDELDPTDGYFVEAEVRPFADVGDQGSGARLFLDLRGFEDFGAEGRTVAALRFALGSIVGASRAETPPDYLFFSGGGATVRGQPFESLGVPVTGADGDEATVGGRSLLAVQSEVRRGITARIGLVGFLDAGFVGEDSFGGDGEFHAGAGLGLRYTTGFGPIRVDLGAPVAGDTGDGLQLYIGIGQAF